LQLAAVQKLVATKEITIDFTEDLREWLAKAGFDPSFGARPLKRTIQRHVINRLSEKILAGEIAAGDHIEVDVDDRGGTEFITKVKAEVAK
jgi:ATP-dependent Clp protease ATP-binding subunit ClpB